MEKNISSIRILVPLAKAQSGFRPVFLMERRVGVPYVEGMIMALMMEVVDAAKLINILMKILDLTEKSSIC